MRKWSKNETEIVDFGLNNDMCSGDLVPMLPGKGIDAIRSHMFRRRAKLFIAPQRLGARKLHPGAEPILGDNFIEYTAMQKASEEYAQSWKALSAKTPRQNIA